MEPEPINQKTLPTNPQESPSTIEFRDVVTEAIERTKGDQKRGRGRPKKENAAPSGKPSHQAPPKPVQRDQAFQLTPDDKKMISGLVATIFGGLDAFLMGRIYKVAEKVASPEEARKMVNDTKLSEFELIQLQTLITAVCEKYEISARWCPEFGLLIVTGGYGLRVVSTLKDLKELVASMNATRQEKQ